MNSIFYLPVWQGILVMVACSTVLGILIVWISRKLIIRHLTKQHERIGRLLFRVSAGLIALLISLSYANERVEHNRVRDSLEIEASLIANVFIKLKLHNSVESEAIKKELVKYVEYTINDKWEEVNANPYYSKITATIVEVNRMVYSLPSNTQNQVVLKSSIISEVNEIVKLMQVRFYAKHSLYPFLVYILGIGIMIMWIFFAVYNVDVLSLIFLSLYNAFLIILIYFIIMLSNPMVGSLKIDANAFNILKTKGIDKMLNQ